MTDADELLDREIEEVKQAVAALEHDIDTLIEAEQDGAARQDLIDWLYLKKHHQELLHDEETVAHMQSHLEEAYRTAAISHKTYQDVKAANKKLMG